MRYDPTLMHQFHHAQGTCSLPNLAQLIRRSYWWRWRADQPVWSGAQGCAMSAKPWASWLVRSPFAAVRQSAGSQGYLGITGLTWHCTGPAPRN